ncbi:tRNA (guanosine(18)-2'-O)-methyltransferase [Polaribacter huanghezhanensis]|uniref:TrmH family RNA methyltransferase n=1 Tax=Polaribacter huanghezhanensis TaxID=1354726 RepID=UPI00264710F8|nr:RNA methyltransferase [Polaribacter huanghezhanensis]WKD86750.1 tRNA (guanosine(18)-2'-O)-methyltransferase [Polaribacter huanghezhanensis]
MIDTKFLHFLEDFVSEKRKETFSKVLENRTRHFTVVLEDIFQPHNSSAVIRSCDIFGLQDVHIIQNKYSSKVSRHVAKGSQKWLDIKKYNQSATNTQDCLDALRSDGYQIIATTPHNDSCVLHEFDITKKSAFVFGVEKEGVSEHTMNQADGFLKIPMVGFTESLNISVAAAIILQDVTTRLRASEIDWKLSEKEKETLYADWIQKSIKSIKKITERYQLSINS